MADKSHKLITKLMRWLVFSVLLAVAPLAGSFVTRMTRKLPTDLDAILANGELLLVTAGIVGAAVGELLGNQHTERRPVPEVIAGGASLLILFFCAVVFADTAAAKAASQAIDGAAVTNFSLLMCGIGLASSASCVLLSET